MNRLTERHYVEKEGYYLKCSETPNCPNDCEECDRLDDDINRLGEYENTGLPPEACANYKTFEDECISKGVTFSRIDELNRKAEARAQARRCREAEQRAAVAEQRAKQAQQDADRKVAMLVLATAAMACMILGVCVMRASAWIGAGLLGAAALLVRWIPREG